MSHREPALEQSVSESAWRDRASTLTFRLLREASSAFRFGLPQAQIRFDLRGTAAGQVRTGAGAGFVIRYNLALLIGYGERFLRRTVPHEVAHVVTHCRFGPRARPHGEEWRETMKWLGADAERCHDYDILGLRQRRLDHFRYHCACGEHTLTSIRRNRWLKGTTYRCLRCGGALQPGPGPEA